MKLYSPDKDGPLQPLVPHGLADLGLCLLGLLALWLGLGLLAPGLWVDPPQPADPAAALAPTRPLWPLLALGRLLGGLPAGWGWLLLPALALVLGGLAFWDKGPRQRFWWRPLFSRALLALLVLGLLLSLWALWGTGR